MGLSIAARQRLNTGHGERFNEIASLAEEARVRIGVLTRGGVEEFRWAKRLGFGALEWIRFEEHPAAEARDWQRSAEEVAEAASALGLRISAIGALYRNPLDPKQTDWARAIFLRAMEVASHIGVKTIAGFPGAVIELEQDARGGHWLYRPFERRLPWLLEFWTPLARQAAERGLRIAFEHCPQGAYHLPVMGYNMLAQPAMWERFFNETPCENLGLEWDPSHLVCQMIDPVQNARRFAAKIFHVHAKDAWIDRALLERYGICHPDVAEHRFPGLGQSNWAEIVHELIRGGYDSDLNVEGRHDPVYRDHSEDEASPMRGKKLEEAGLKIALQTLAPLAAGTEPS